MDLRTQLASYGDPLSNNQLAFYLVELIKEAHPQLADTLDDLVSADDATESHKQLDYLFKRLRSTVSKDAGRFSPSSARVLQTQRPPRDQGARTQSRQQSRHPQGAKCEHCKQKHPSTDCWFTYPQKAPKWWQESRKERAEHKKTGISRPKRDKDESQTTEPNTEVLSVCAATASIQPTDFYLDSCSAIHIVNTREHYVEYSTNVTISLQGFNGSTARSRGSGTIRLPVSGRTLLVQNVHYCPESRYNLIGFYALLNKAVTTALNGRKLTIIGKTWSITAELNTNNNLLQIQTGDPHRPVAATTQMQATDTSDKESITSALTFDSSQAPAASLEDWHYRLGHANTQAIIQLSKLGRIRLTNQNFDSLRCVTCTQSKLTRKPSHQAFRPTTERLQRVHVDLVGGGNTLQPSTEGSPDDLSAGGQKYAMILVDDYSKYRWIYFLQRKDQAAIYLHTFIKLCNTQYGKTPTCFRSDGGTEFSSKSFNKFLTDHGVQWETTAPYTPEQDGVAERSIRTVVQMARSMIISSKLPHSLWAEAFNHAIKLINSTPTRSTHLTDKTWTTPHKAFFNEEPQYSHLKPFGCLSFTRQTHITDKLEPRGLTTAYLGFTSSQIHRLWDGKSIVSSRDVKFHENQYFTDYIRDQSLSDITRPIAAADLNLLV